MKRELTYYSQAGIMTDPGPFLNLLDNLPSGIADLCSIVQGVMIHIFWAERYGICLSPEQKAEVQLRSLKNRLERISDLDPRLLTENRPLNRKSVGNCRDFSLLLVSILRHQGVPARARCGFGAYFQPGRFEDHWVCEYWNAVQDRWILVDSQLDAFQCQALKVRFDPLDVPRDQFIVAGRAWQLCRSNQADPKTFGIFDMNGLGFVRGNVVRDLASLNKVELLPWDCWGIIEGPEPKNLEDMAFLDQVAGTVSNDAPDFKTVRLLYETDPRLRMGGTLHSYFNGGMHIIQISAD
jgi:hypothetical protein